MHFLFARPDQHNKISYSVNVLWLNHNISLDLPESLNYLEKDVENCLNVFGCYSYPSCSALADKVILANFNSNESPLVPVI